MLLFYYSDIEVIMKKFISFLFCILFLSLSAFAEYKPIPQNLSKQYKADIERIIDEEYPKALKQVDKIYNEAYKKYLKVLHNPKNIDIYMDFATCNYDTAVDTPAFNLFDKLIDITNKYISFNKYEIPPVDYSGALYDFMEPYFKDNYIDTSKIDSLAKYSNNYYHKIETYYNNAHKVVYPEEH